MGNFEISIYFVHYLSKWIFLGKNEEKIPWISYINNCMSVIKKNPGNNIYILCIENC